MKRKIIFKYILTIASVIYFILAGTGYNIAKYCCNDCEDAGMEFIAHHSCESIHKDTNHENHDICCSHDSEIKFEIFLTEKFACGHNNSCDISRVVLDDFSPSQLIQINEQSFKYLSSLNFNINHTIAFGSYVSDNQRIFTPPDRIPHSGRYLLTLNTVLII